MRTPTPQAMPKSFAFVFGFCAALSSVFAQVYSFTTLAGAQSEGSADGPTASALFRTPYDVAVDSIGNIYVADTSNHTIRKISP